jgi:nitronate monooxygenase
MKLATALNKWFPQIEFPIIMAPMFLVTNQKMMEAAMDAKILGCIPALNFRTIPELTQCLDQLNKKNFPYGVNLIVNQSNPHFKDQLKICLEKKVAFIITSLGSPEEVIEKAKPLGIKVFCDVTELKYSQKVVSLGADALIAVNSGAGGHLGKITSTILIPLLKKHFPKTPIIAAGGVGTGSGIIAMLALGAEGFSIGSPYIASTEAGISDEYKQACVKYGAEDIAVTTKLSGSSCTVISTPYVKSIGLDQNFLEKFLNKNKKVKKYLKMLTFYRGMKLLEKSAFQATYQSVWCAGQSIEFTEKISSIKEITNGLIKECHESYESFKEKMGA